MNKDGVRKNYGSRMISGDEKLTSLRSVPRCALAFGSDRLTRGYGATGVAPPFGPNSPYRANFPYPLDVI